MPESQRWLHCPTGKAVAPEEGINRGSGTQSSMKLHDDKEDDGLVALGTASTTFSEDEHFRWSEVATGWISVAHLQAYTQPNMVQIWRHMRSRQMWTTNWSRSWWWSSQASPFIGKVGGAEGRPDLAFILSARFCRLDWPKFCRPLFWLFGPDLWLAFRLASWPFWLAFLPLHWGFSCCMLTVPWYHPLWISIQTPLFATLLAFSLSS